MLSIKHKQSSGYRGEWIQEPLRASWGQNFVDGLDIWIKEKAQRVSPVSHVDDG